MAVKTKISGFTLVEMLTVVAIIAIVVSLLIPAVNMVRTKANIMKQRSQFAAIEMALLAFKSDFGDYPESKTSQNYDYCGTQKLCEALLGWDLRGFHPKSVWDAYGYGPGVDNSTYDPDNTRFDNDGISESLKERKELYLELSTANAFRLAQSDPDTKDGLFKTVPTLLEGNTYVLCDSFGIKKLRIGDKVFTAGSPILYYKADPSKKTISTGTPPSQRIYNAGDNMVLLQLKIKGKDPDLPHPLGDDIENFYASDYDGGIRDTTLPNYNVRPQPHNPDSYILISAGPDGEYGTKDDIRNF